MFTVPKMRELPEIRIGANEKYSIDGGLNLLRHETALPYYQASNILNVNTDGKGTLNKRKGQASLDTSLGSGGCTSIVYKGKIIKQWKTSLYSENLDGSNSTLIYSNLANSKAFFIIFQGLLYMLNGTNYIQYDGSIVQEVIPYVPQITQGRKPNGSETALYEPYNFLTGKAIDSFTSDGTSEYILSSKNLVSIDEIKVNETIITTGFTKDTVNGKVTFNTPPPTSTTPNNVKITITIDNQGAENHIKNCTYATEFSTRLFITGNPNYPNRLWKTYPTPNQSTVQANYFPVSGLSSFETVTGIESPMKAFIKKFDKLVYLKTNSTHITFNETQSDGTSGFPISNINETIGCDMPGSVQLIDNKPVFFNSEKGGYIIISTNVLGENEILGISANINGNSLRVGLLEETKADLLNCCSYDDGSKYYLCMPSSGNCYVWDYSLGYSLANQESLHWFKYNNIHANNFFEVNGILCYSDSQTGRIVKFIDSLNDFGLPINAVWKSKLMDFDATEWYKNITDIWITTRANSNSTLTINYYDDNGNLTTSKVVPKSLTRSFNWSNWVWSDFTWKSQKFSPTLRFKPGIKSIRYYQLELSNNEFNQDLSIISVVIKYAITRKVR